MELMELMGPRLPPFEWTGRKSPFGGIDGVDGIDGASPSLLSNGRSRKVRSAELMELMELMGGSRPVSFRVSPGFIPGVVRFHSGSRPVWHPHKKNAQFDQKALVRTSSDPEQLKERQRRLEEAGAFRAPTNAARLPAPVRGGAGRGVLRCDDGAGHRWLGDPVEARLAGASRVRGA